MQDDGQQIPMLREHIFAINGAGELVGGIEAWCGLTGHDPAAVTARSWLDAVDPRDRDAVAGVWSTDPRLPFGTELRLRRVDGDTRWIALRLVPVRSEERRVGKECRSRGSPYDYREKRL